MHIVGKSNNQAIPYPVVYNPLVLCPRGSPHFNSLPFLLGIGNVSTHCAILKLLIAGIIYLLPAMIDGNLAV